ncbi:hypothetical protein L226DRAFT_537181 [Lentinus tigrinus ALCF2SS1-7]|uniref:uncharacterized protein n=1 Tax=Lentinus tigrinus ALCF2SS1-7 TaxID=1328758 RepID=UPI0011661B8F|nr:hypothetical protein L226DRAFT_537181 [Lentinus tigrinus ALCF2SS1-7]
MVAPTAMRMQTFVQAASRHPNCALCHSPSSHYSPRPSTTPRPRTLDDDEATMVDIDLEVPGRPSHTRLPAHASRKLERNFFGMENATRGGIALRVLTCIVATVVASGVTYATCILSYIIPRWLKTHRPDIDLTAAEELQAASMRRTLVALLYGCAVSYAVIVPIVLMITLVRKTWRRDGGGIIRPGYHEYIAILALLCFAIAFFALLVGEALMDPTKITIDSFVGWIFAAIPPYFILSVVVLMNPAWVAWFVEGHTTL